MVGRGDRSDHRHERPGRPDRPHGHGQRGHPIDLSWSAPASTGGSAITGYKIEVSPNGTSGWTDQVANTNSTATTYAHTGLPPATTRHYRVSAINANGAGTASNVDSATTGAGPAAAVSNVVAAGHPAPAESPRPHGQRPAGLTGYDQRSPERRPATAGRRHLRHHCRLQDPGARPQRRWFRHLVLDREADLARAERVANHHPAPPPATALLTLFTPGTTPAPPARAFIPPPSLPAARVSAINNRQRREWGAISRLPTGHGHASADHRDRHLLDRPRAPAASADLPAQRRPGPTTGGLLRRSDLGLTRQSHQRSRAHPHSTLAGTAPWTALRHRHGCSTAPRPTSPAPPPAPGARRPHRRSRPTAGGTTAIDLSWSAPWRHRRLRHHRLQPDRGLQRAGPSSSPTRANHDLRAHRA